MPDKNENLPKSQRMADAKKAVWNDLLSIASIVNSNRYITLDNDTELHIYSIYMTYRVQQDLYEVCREGGQFRDLSWDDFVLLLRGNRPARVSAIVVVQETLSQFYRSGHYNFDVTEVDFKYGEDAGDDETGFLHCSALFPGEEGIGLIESLLFYAEFAMYRRQVGRRTDYSWDQFLDELEQKGQLWSQVLAAFRDALARLDFKPLWRSEKLEELVWQAATED